MQSIGLIAKNWFLILAVVASAVAQQRYEVTQLPTLGGPYVLGRAINASGQVTGFSATSGNAQHAFLYTAGNMTDLGSLGTQAIGFALNASAQVVGMTTLSTNFNFHAFFDSQGVMQDLGVFGGITTRALSINNSSQVTICAQGSPQGGAFLYSASTNSAISLTAEIGSSDACPTAINNSGEIAGGYFDALGTHAFVLSGGKRIDIRPPVPTNDSFGMAINESGQVAGNYSRRNIEQIITERAFLYSGRKAIDLGALDAGPCAPGRFNGECLTEVFGSSAINKYGQIVGLSACRCTFGAHAFLYTPGKGMVDLNNLVPKNLGVILMEAWGINDAGQIIVTDGGFNSFLLTPIKSK